MQLLDMVAEVATLVPEVPWRVLIVGAGPLESRILRARRALDIVDRVQLTGQLTRNEVREVYRRADVYVAPSFRESFGIAPLEARSAGLAVVAMRSGGVGEFVRHGVEGLLCDDDADMVRALALLAAEPVVLDRLTTYNRVHRPTLDWGVTLEGYEAAYARAAQLAGRLLPRR
jgi:glycosyltransferase involved in cell wall biosynthesis